MDYFDSSESGKFRTFRPPRGGPRKEQVAEWITWVIRLLIPIICGLAYRQMLAMEDLQLTIAKMSVQQDNQTKQLDDHSRQIEGIWRQLRNRQ